MSCFRKKACRFGRRHLRRDGHRRRCRVADYGNCRQNRPVRAAGAENAADATIYKAAIDPR